MLEKTKTASDDMSVKTGKENKSFQAIDSVISRHKGKHGSLLATLEDVQKLHPHKYLSPDVLEYVAEKTKTPLSKIYSVVTFYAFFNLDPQGENSIVICRGTACHTRRSKEILDFLTGLLGLKEQSARRKSLCLTTEDNKFTLRTVACFGQCALAPVVELNGKIHSHVTQESLRQLINKLKKAGKK